MDFCRLPIHTVDDSDRYPILYFLASPKLPTLILRFALPRFVCFFLICMDSQGKVCDVFATTFTVDMGKEKFQSEKSTSHFDFLVHVFVRPVNREKDGRRSPATLQL